MIRMKIKKDTEKNGLMSLGYIYNEDTLSGRLSNISGKSAITLSELNNNIDDSYTKNKMKYYFYDDFGDLKECSEKESYQFYLVDTGYKNKKTKEEIYAVFQLNQSYGWAGVHFQTSKEFYNRNTAYTFGNISFRDFTEANNFICKLHNMLLPGEKWNFKEENYIHHRKKTDFPILQSYLKYVFEKLMDGYHESGLNENKIVFDTERKHAVFNTGLLSNYAREIIVGGTVFNLKENFTFNLSNIEIVDSLHEIEDKFNITLEKNPEPVVFYTHIEEITFDASKQISFSNNKMNHIIQDGKSRKRIPEKYAKLSDKQIAIQLQSAIDDGLKIAKRNYKYVVPQYRPNNKSEDGKIQFLLPIYLDNDFNKEPDFALVLNPSKNFYIPETILELSWAYSNARVICKPDETWLKPERIELDSTEEQDVNFNDD